MKYGIIVCSNCKTPKAFNINDKSTKCIRCNKRLIINKLSVLYKSNSLDDIKRFIGLLNAKRDNRYDEFKDLIKNKKI